MPAPIAFLNRVPLFNNIGADELLRLASVMTRARFAQGETIFHQGDIGQALYLVETGQVRIYVLGEGGYERSVVIYGPRDIFGELALIDDQPRSASAVAQEPTVVWTLGRERFRELMAVSPQFTFNFMHILCDRVRHTTQQVDSLTSLSVPERLARKLIELTRDHGVPEGEGMRLAVTLTQSDLASLIGATRESTNKTLRAFQRKGLVVMRNGKIVVVNPVWYNAALETREGTFE